MDISGLSNSGLIALAQTMNANRLQEKVSVAVMQMANNQIKQDGENMLRLIASTPEGTLGSNIDLMA